MEIAFKIHNKGKRVATIFTFLCLLASPSLCGAGPIAAKQLQVNYLDEPIGLDSWQVPAAPEVMAQDVTERLQSLVTNGQIAVPVQTAVVVVSGVDPAPGKVKTLNVSYHLDGNPGTTTAEEGKELHLGTAGAKLIIDNASYGSTSAEKPSKMRFGWVVEDARRGALQSAYQIRVATSKELLEKNAADVWNSGEVASALQNGIVFEGKPLSGKTAYWWQVQLWDETGKAGAWSEPATFETGILSRTKDWNGAYVSGKDPRDQRPFNYYRQRFNVPAGKTISRARAYAAGDTKNRGFWDFRINGQRADDTVILKEGGYFAFDVTKFVRPGENVVGAIFGDDTDKDMTAKIWICDVDVWFTDNTRLTFGTDATCKGFRGGPFITANELDGVVYDARKEAEITGWDKPGFKDANWLPLQVIGDLRPNRSFQRDAVRLQKILPAVAMTTPVPGVRIYDLGTNISGWSRLTVSGKAGATVTLRHTERLNADGTLDRSSNLNGIPAQAINRYTLKGGGTEVWEPWLAWHGFRYVEVTGDVALTPQGIEGRWIHSDIIRRSTTFSCSDQLLNELFTAFRVSELDNSMYFHIDCNQRGERAPWAADAYACSAPSMAMFDSADFWQRWISTSNQQIGPRGEANYEVRVGGGGFALFWQAYCLFIPWDFHQAYGDHAALRISYERARLFSDCFINWFDTLDADVVFNKKEEKVLSSSNKNDFLIETETAWKTPEGNNEENPMWYWGDWLHPRKSELGATKHTSVLASMFYFHCLNITAQEAEILGLKEDAAKYSALAAKVKNAVNERYLMPNGYRSYSPENAQSPNAMALSIGIVPEEHRAAVAGSLVADIRSRDTHLDTGLLGVLHLMRALTQTGHDDVALDLARQTSYPSWGYMVTAPRAPGTFWEHWDNQDMSKNHPFLGGSLATWLLESVGGIRPLSPGYSTIAFKPDLAVMKSLTHAATSMPTVRGVAAFKWKWAQGALAFDVSVPANVTGQVFIPALAGDATTIREGDAMIWSEGKFKPGVAGITAATVVAGYVRVEVGSGHYHFRSR